MADETEEAVTTTEKTMWADGEIHQQLKVMAAVYGIPMKAMTNVVLQKFIDDYNRAPGLYPRSMFKGDDNE